MCLLVRISQDPLLYNQDDDGMDRVGGLGGDAGVRVFVWKVLERSCQASMGQAKEGQKKGVIPESQGDPGQSPSH